MDEAAIGVELLEGLLITVEGLSVTADGPASV